MQSKLIGITGKAGAGKDTIADYFVKEHGYVRYSMADGLKHALNAMFGWTMEHWANREWKEYVDPKFGKSPRQLAQTLGTEWGRKLVNEDLWIILAEDFIRASKKPVVIPDIRFDNEANLVHGLAGELIRVVRTDSAAVSAHQSEAGVTRWVDWEFSNNGSIEELHHKLRKVFG